MMRLTFARLTAVTSNLLRDIPHYRIGGLLREHVGRTAIRLVCLKVEREPNPRSVKQPVVSEPAHAAAGFVIHGDQVFTGAENAGPNGSDRLGHGGFDFEQISGVRRLLRKR